MSKLEYVSQISPVCPDALRLYALISHDGKCADTALFTSPQKSIIVKKSALKIEYHEGHCQIQGFSPTGEMIKQKHFAKPLAFAKNNADLLTDEERIRQPSIFDCLRQLLALLPPAHHLLGVFSFDLIDTFETLPALNHDPLQFPDFLFYLPEELVVIDNATQQTVCSVLTSQSRLAGLLADCQNAENIHATLFSTLKSIEAPCATSHEEFTEMVKACQQHIQQGDIFQTVLSRRFTLPCSNPFAAFQRLIASNPSPYLYYFKTATHTLFGASPETCVKVENKVVSLYPIAGTKPRGANSAQDLRQETALRTSSKELAEHMMLVDLARNDIARICVPGTCQVKELATLTRFSKVMHLCSTVQGTLQPDLDALHAYQACMNMGTVSGAPKIKATEILRKQECEKRGPYGGAIGWISPEGNMDTALFIRSAVVYQDIAHIRAGAGIVADSDATAEAYETQYKAQAVINAINFN